MDPITRVSSEQGKRPVMLPSSSKCLQEDDALSVLMTKDPSLGQVMKIILGKLNETNMKLDETNEKLNETNRKLDETNKKLDGFHNELRRDLDACQDQVTKLLEAQGMENDEVTTMEMIPTVNAKELEEKRLQLMDDCLGLPTILRRILEQFSDKELIHLSLVNKLWNYEARTVLRDRGSLKATINSEPVCQRLVEFASDLRQMRVIPFNGICIKIIHYGDTSDICDSRPIDTKLDPAYRDIVDLLPWKHLSVDLDEELWYCKGCPALVLVKRILEDCCGVLEELSISSLDSDKIEFVQSAIQDRSFPSLKTLTVFWESHARSVPNLFMKELVSRAPNLREFHIDDIRKFDPKVMEGSSSKLVIASGLRPLNDPVCESLLDGLRTEKIGMYLYCDENFQVELFDRLVPKVLQGSHKSLKSFSMDLLFAVPLMCYGICLENVTELEIYVTDPVVASIQPNILAVVKGFEFSRIFPKLNRVGISGWNDRSLSSEDISAFVERGNAVARQALPNRAMNIKHLEINGSLGYLTTLLLNEMCPHITEITVRGETRVFPFKILWEHFRCLVELHVDLNHTDTIVNLDSAFCGIFREEVAELRTKDDEYLKAVNIVPVMPSVTCLKDLSSLTFYHSTFRGERRFTYSAKDSLPLFTKVTELLAFQRAPDLAVTLIMGRENYKVVCHTKPDWSILPVGSASVEQYQKYFHEWIL